MRRVLYFVVVSSVFWGVLPVNSAYAQNIPPYALQPNHHYAPIKLRPWKQAGGPECGNFGAIAATPTGTLLSGTSTFTSGMGIYRSTDNGGSWTGINGGPSLCASTSIVISPNQYIFSGAPSGVMRSNDDGLTWIPVNSGLGYVPRKLAINSSGHLFAATYTGVYRTRNNGNSWQALNNGIPLSKFSSVSVSPSGHVFASGLSGLYRSTDNGDSWSNIGSGLTGGVVQSYAFHSSGSMFVTTSYLFKSTNNGDSFSQVNKGSFYGMVSLFAAPNGDLFTGRQSIYGLHPCLYRSNDGGISWFVSEGGLDSKPVPTQMAVDGTGNYVLATWNGVFRSIDGGANWSPINKGFSAAVVDVLRVNSAGHVFASVSAGGIYRSLDNGASWVQLANGFYGRHIDGLVVGPGDILVAGDGSNPDIWRSTDNGNTWTHYKNVPASGASIRDFKYNNAGYLFAGTSKGVFRSGDDGITWTKTSQGLPSSAYILKLTTQPDGDVYAVAYKDAIYRSGDNGASWTIANTGLPSETYYGFHGDSKGVLYAAPANSQYSIYRSDNDGATWFPVGPKGMWFSVTSTPFGGLFAGRTDGVSYSFDNGMTWMDITEGMIPSRIVTLTFSPKGYLFAGSLGSGVFTLRL